MLGPKVPRRWEEKRKGKPDRGQTDPFVGKRANQRIKIVCAVFAGEGRSYGWIWTVF